MNKRSVWLLEELSELYPLGISPSNYVPKLEHPGISMYTLSTLTRYGYVIEYRSGLFKITDKGLNFVNH